VVSPCELRFRTAEELAASLADASFSTESMFGAWDRSQVSPSAPELIVVATRS
jgi:hypothetical protein